MNKKVLFILLILLFPMIINAKECNHDKHQEYVNVASSITYDNNYKKGTDRYTIVVYNIFDGLYVKYNKEKYEPDSESKVTITDIKPGSNPIIKVYADDGCDEIKVIDLIEAYYNPYYDSAECDGYKDKISVCSTQFTSSRVTKELVDEAKNNYGKSIQGEVKQKEKEEKPGVLTRIKNFIDNWGIKIVLVVVTIFITSTLFNIKFRKIKHGI